MKKIILITSILLLVSILASIGLCHDITNVVFTPPAPADLDFSEHVEYTFDYETDEATGVRIWSSPLAGGVPASSFMVSSSPLLPTGTGSGSGFFTIQTGAVTVDQVRMYMWDADVNQFLHEVFIDVEYNFGPVTPNETSTWGGIKALF